MLRARRRQPPREVRKIPRYVPRYIYLYISRFFKTLDNPTNLLLPTKDRYIQLLKENKAKGYRGQQQNYIPGVDGPAGGPEILTNYPTAQQAKGGKGSDLRPGNTSGHGGDVLY